MGWGTHSIAPFSFCGATYPGGFTLLPTHGEILREVIALVDSGTLKPVLDPRHFALDTVIDAHAAAETGRPPAESSSTSRRVSPGRAGRVVSAGPADRGPEPQGPSGHTRGGPHARSAAVGPSANCEGGPAGRRRTCP
ncbi:zinc-binding dehydrogenase [Streptomyces sp. NPDC127117]|uniref:zinc-binding dehydrogenase n=1 Tax=Streptomyces sp. NPDC127117 TaxID=3345368 RepID=UPI00362B3DE9